MVPMARSTTALAFGGAEGSNDRDHSQAPQSLVEVSAETGIAIADDKTRLMTPRCGSDELAPDPGGGGMARHVPMLDAPASVIDENEAVERPKGEHLDGEEVDGPNVWGV